jgi:hypothetical protein
MIHQVGVGQDDLQGGKWPKVQIPDSFELKLLSYFCKVDLYVAIWRESLLDFSHDQQVAPEEVVWGAWLTVVSQTLS